MFTEGFEKIAGTRSVFDIAKRVAGNPMRAAKAVASAPGQLATKFRSGGMGAAKQVASNAGSAAAGVAKSTLSQGKSTARKGIQAAYRASGI